MSVLDLKRILMETKINHENIVRMVTALNVKFDELQKGQQNLIKIISGVSVKCDELLKRQENCALEELTNQPILKLKDIGCPFETMDHMEAFEKLLEEPDFRKQLVIILFYYFKYNILLDIHIPIFLDDEPYGFWRSYWKL